MRYILKWVYTNYQKGGTMKKAEHVGVYLKLNKEEDQDIIKRLNQIKESVKGPNTKQGYIKDLIRTDIVLDAFRDGVNNGLVHTKKG